MRWRHGVRESGVTGGEGRVGGQRGGRGARLLVPSVVTSRAFVGGRDSSRLGSWARGRRADSVPVGYPLAHWLHLPEDSREIGMIIEAARMGRQLNSNASAGGTNQR